MKKELGTERDSALAPLEQLGPAEAILAVTVALLMLIMFADLAAVGFRVV